jgi:hypothetical protein
VKITQELLNTALNNGGIPERYARDCDIICYVVRERMGLDLSPSQASRIWDSHSSHLCASWLIVREDDPEEIVSAVERFVRTQLESLL